MHRLYVPIALSLLIASPAPAQEDPVWPTPEISSDISLLPEPVRAKRQALIDAARSGEIEALQTIIDAQKSPPRVSFGDPEDGVAYLKGISEDDEGRQILGLLVDLLDQPFAYYPDSGGETNYIWPYLSELDPAALTPEQTVDAYRLLHAEQLQELRDLEAWYFWRLYITESGEWTAFVAGD